MKRSNASTVAGGVETKRATSGAVNKPWSDAASDGRRPRSTTWRPSSTGSQSRSSWGTVVREIGCNARPSSVPRVVGCMIGAPCNRELALTASYQGHKMFPVPAAVPQTMLSPPVVPHTMLSPPVVPQTMLSPPVVPQTMLSPPVVPQTMLSPPAVPHTMLSPPVVPQTTRGQLKPPQTVPQTMFWKTPALTTHTTISPPAAPTTLLSPPVLPH